MEYDVDCLNRKFAHTFNSIETEDGRILTGYIGDVDSYEQHATFEMTIYKKVGNTVERCCVRTESTEIDGSVIPEGWLKASLLYQHFPSGWYWERRNQCWLLLVRLIRKAYKVGISNDSHTVLYGEHLEKSARPLTYKWDFNRRPTIEEGFYSRTIRINGRELSYLNQRIGYVEEGAMLLDFPGMERFVNKEKQWQIL